MEGTVVAVESVRAVGPDTIALELETPDDFDAVPGQFVLIRATPEDEEVARHYTLSSPSVEDTFELTVGIDPDGDLSPWLATLERGATVSVEGPFGTITYERDGDAVAIAGGPGVGPAVSIAEAATEGGYDAHVIYQDDEPAHVDRLEALESQGSSVTFVDDGDEQALADAIETHLNDGQLYVFGFDEFVRSVADMIDAAGGDADEAAIENFG